MKCCSNCGKELQEDTKFCPSCGTKVEEKEETLEDALSGSIKPSEGYPASGDIQAAAGQPVAGSLNTNTNSMKFCSHCGKQILKDAVVCPHCGCAVESVASVTDEPNKGLNIISFLLPIVGLILYLVYHEKEPKKAAAVGKWALYGVGFAVLCAVLLPLCVSAILYSLY